jgi:toxin-antitoxin system PIN domain toxin
MSMHWLPDVNIWLALGLPEHVHHRTVTDWWNSDDEPIYFCRASQQGLLRLLTTAAVLAPYKLAPLSNRQAQVRMDEMLDLERVRIADEPQSIDADWKRYADSGLASPKLWMDAYLAAFARCGGYRLVTTDKGFKQFKGIDVLLLK